LSFPFSQRSLNQLAGLAKTSGKSKSVLVKTIIIQAKSDLLDNQNPSITKEFQEKIAELS
jgi:hypothetical protein